MRAIIDADHLPTAVRYYSRVLREPAQSAQNDISITSVDAEHKVTLESLLKKLQGYASSGETEFLLVLHSDPNGLLLPIGGGFGGKITADKSVLKMIQLASIAFGNLDDSKNPDMAVNDAFLIAWMDFFSNTPNVNTSAISSTSGVAAKCTVAVKLCQLWIKGVCKHVATTEANLRAMADLADRVRDANIQRLEFRSCRLGAGNGLKEVASFRRHVLCADSPHLLRASTRPDREATGKCEQNGPRARATWPPFHCRECRRRSERRCRLCDPGKPIGGR